jgi:PAS domain S-box-containing protein
MEARRPSLGEWLASVMPGSRHAPPPEFAASLIENLADAVLACDADGKIVLLNRRAREGGDGFPAHATLPSSVPPDRWAQYFKLYSPGASELLPTHELPLMRALKGESVRDVQLEARGDNGALAVINVSGGPVLDADGRIQGAVVVVQDVTERVASESRLELGGAVAANIGLGVSMVRAGDGQIVWANEQWERLFGYGPGELTGRHISAVNAPTSVSPEERAEQIFDALERDGVWGGEFRNVRKDGTLLWTYANISCFDHPSYGSVWITASMDITARKENEAELHTAAERFQAVFEDAPLGIALMDTEGDLVDANRLLCAMVGRRRDELVGRPFDDLVHPDDRNVDSSLAARVFNGELPRYRAAKRLVRADGEPLETSISTTVMRAPDGRPLYKMTFVDEAH